MTTFLIEHWELIFTALLLPVLRIYRNKSKLVATLIRGIEAANDEETKRRVRSQAGVEGLAKPMHKQVKKVTAPDGNVPIRSATLVLALALALAGCARFSTKQSDTSYDDTGKPQRTISTRVSATTFFDSQSALTAFKASQTDKTQGASVGALNQNASSTNLNAIADRVGRAVLGLP